MSNYGHSTILSLHRETIRATLEEAFRFFRRKARMDARISWRGQPPGNGQGASFNPETAVTFVRKEAERALNHAAFVDNMSVE